MNEDGRAMDEGTVISIGVRRRGMVCRGRIRNREGQVSVKYEGDEACGRIIKRIADIYSEEVDEE